MSILILPNTPSPDTSVETEHLPKCLTYRQQSYMIFRQFRALLYSTFV